MLAARARTRMYCGRVIGRGSGGDSRRGRELASIQVAAASKKNCDKIICRLMRLTFFTPEVPVVTGCALTFSIK